MHEHINPEDLSGEERFELEAAFGKNAVENGDIVEIDTDELEPADEPEPPASFADVDEVESGEKVAVGDVVTIRLMSGTEWTGECTDVTDESYMHRFKLEGEDPHGEYDTIPKSFQYEDFEGADEPGITHELISVE